MGVLDNTARLATAVGVMNEIMQDLNRDGGKPDSGAATPDWGEEDGGDVTGEEKAEEKTAEIRREVAKKTAEKTAE